MRYKIIRVLNNSVVLAKDLKNSSEVVLLGKGIGIGVNKRNIPEIPTNKIEQIFELKESQNNSYLKDLINSVSPEIISVTSEILRKAERMLQTTFRAGLFFTVLDHLSFAVEKSKEGIDNSYPYLDEMKFLLKEEYEVCLVLVDYINQRLSVHLKKDEAVLLAIHFASARVDSRDDEEEIIREILEIISMKLNIDLSDEQIKLQRLKNHLRLFLKTNTSRGEKLKKESIRGIEKVLSEDYKVEYNCSQLIVEFLKKKHHLIISRDEAVYLTMHIVPIVTECEEVGKSESSRISK